MVYRWLTGIALFGARQFENVLIQGLMTRKILQPFRISREYPPSFATQYYRCSHSWTSQLSIY
jgi:hypothetical protein